MALPPSTNFDHGNQTMVGTWYSQLTQSFNFVQAEGTKIILDWTGLKPRPSAHKAIALTLRQPGLQTFTFHY